jgi:alkanesulfonate monooxygenase SsuD/methylene tetrahydromethanopterin reductase-like flavin-dependent oxidoreductase (luciferase family)
LAIESAVRKIQDLYLEGKEEEAMAAVPQQLIEELTLIGPKEKVRDELEAWRESAVTTLLVSGDAQMLRDAAELVLG